MPFDASATLRSSLILLLAVTTAACGRKAAKADQYSYSVFVDEGAGAVQSVQLNGTALAAPTQHPGGKSFRVTLPSSEYATEKSFTVTMNTTCGAEQLPAQLAVGIARSSTRDGEDRERAETKPGEPIVSTLQFAAPARARVLLDTDGAGDRVVHVGATKLDGGKEHQEVTLGTCASARDVKIDGTRVGELNTKPHTATDATGKNVEIAPTTIVDVSGNHCYEKVLHVYRDKEATTFEAARATPERLEGSRVYAQSVDDFLKPPPDELKSAEFLVSRTELRRCSKKTARRR